MKKTKTHYERQAERREEYRKNGISVPLLRADRISIEKHAQMLGLTNAGFLRMLAKQYIEEREAKRNDN